MSIVSIVVILSALLFAAPPADERVRLVALPPGSIQPQARVDSHGGLRLLLFRGEPSGGDLFVTQSHDGGRTFAAERRVNGDASRAVATGTVRAAQLALGRDDSLHVVWMGATGAQPRAPGNATPLLHARGAGDGAAFSAPRNLITAAVGLDGGFDVAADGRGTVAVVWHAPAPREEGEAARRVWLARSADDGATFSAEAAVDAPRHGVCACCGMRAIFSRAAAAADERLWILYRCALEGKNRDMHALVVHGAADPVRSLDLSPWPANGCVMSTAALADGTGDALFAAWETKGQVFAQRFAAAGGVGSEAGADAGGAAIAAPGSTGNRKHPRVAVNAKGEWLFCWMEGTAWERGGALAWQLYDKSGKPIDGASGRIEGVPVWSFGEPVALKDDRFILIH